MSEVLTYSEYYSEIESIGKEALSIPERERDDWVWETLDGHEYVIYTAKAAAVLLHSSNDEALFEDGARSFKNLSDVYTQGAFLAMLADVREWLDANPDDEEEDEVEDEDEDEDEDEEVEEALGTCLTCGAEHGCDEQGNRRRCDLDFEE